MKLNNRDIDTHALEIDGIDSSDYPDFCDAYFSYAEYTDGTPLDDSELEELSYEYGDVLNEMAHDSWSGMIADAHDYLQDL